MRYWFKYKRSAESLGMLCDRITQSDHPIHPVRNSQPMDTFSNKYVLALALIVSSLLVTVSEVSAQSLTPTPQQIEQLQNLSDEQRRQLLDRQIQSDTSTDQPVVDINVVTPRGAEATEPQSDQPDGPPSDRLVIDQQPEFQSPDLEAFGYDLFAGSPTTFAPATNIPVPSTYVIGPGDTVIVQLYGQQNQTLELVVTREGQLMFPEIGPVNVSGLSFDDLRGLLQGIVANQLIGQNASITMGPLRSIDVFVLGEAFRPGSYTVSSLSTMTNALFVSGGVTTVGSLRSIQLMRSGQQVTELDLYDLLLRGDTSGDARLLPGDVIFIPPVGRTVSIAGEVRRPAIYEIKDETTAAEVLALSGGLRPTAYPAASRIERINNRGERTLIDVDLTDSGSSPALADGDLLQISSVMDQLEEVVLIRGHVQRPGGFQWRQGLQISDVLPSIDRMLPDPDLSYAVVVREILPTRRVELFHVDLGNAINSPGSSADLQLQPRDQLFTFGASEGRREQLDAFLQRLDDQSSFDAPPLVVTVSGNVRFPGRYPLVQGMSLADAIDFAGGLNAETDLENVLMERRLDAQGTVMVERHALDAQTLDTESPVELRELDNIIVFSVNQPREELLEDTLARLRAQASNGRQTEVVSISGAIRYPGDYPLAQGLTADALVNLAGGYLENADTSRAELARYGTDSAGRRELGIRELDMRVVGTSGRDSQLMSFDALTVPRIANWRERETVTISGEVYSPGTYLIGPEDTIVSLIARAGGLTDEADPAGAIFLREALREAEQLALEQAREELEQALLIQRLEASEESSAPSEADMNALLDEIDNTTPTGRLVINLPEELSGRQEATKLRAEDTLLIPPARVEVTVSGEVYQPASFRFEPGENLSDYVSAAGGYTSEADTGAVYVIRSSGRVELFSGMRWFFQGRSRIEPGDTIVVPTEVFQPGQLQVVTSVSQILFNLSTTLLAIQRVGN